MKKVLKLKFLDSDKKKRTLVIKDPKQGLTQEVVKAAMEKIAASNVFSKDGVSKFATVEGASYYTTQSDDIFAEEAKSDK